MRVRSMRALAIGVMVALVVPLAPSGASAITVGNGHGCTPGFWKNHTKNWQEYNPGTTLGSPSTQLVFPPELSHLASATFIEALQWGGGTTLEDAARNLLKHAVTAYLNAAHDDLRYPYRRFATGANGERPLRDLVNEALASLDRDVMLSLKDALDRVNNADCSVKKPTNKNKKRKGKKGKRANRR